MKILKYIILVTILVIPLNLYAQTATPTPLLDEIITCLEGEVPTVASGVWSCGSAGIAGLFMADINGDLEPVTDINTDVYYELDGNDDIMPKAE